MLKKINSQDFCIAVASHISNKNRISYLIECLISLTTQKMPISVYLSISFGDNEIKMKTLNSIKNEDKIVNEHLNILVRNEKTPQMRHYYLLNEEHLNKYKWIMFCDDDDSYIPERTKMIMECITINEEYVKDMNKDEEKYILGGLYENISKEDHRIKRHEYWCYCIKQILMYEFYRVVSEKPDVLNDKCCDVLFGEYLRRKSTNWLYARINTPMYNYRIEENTDSVTGFIQTNQNKYTNQTSPPNLNDEKWIDYVLNWNEFLQNNIHIFLHDTYLRTLVGVDLDNILRTEFQNNYFILDYVDQKHILQITELHNRVKGVCAKIYDLGL